MHVLTSLARSTLAAILSTVLVGCESGAAPEPEPRNRTDATAARQRAAAPGVVAPRKRKVRAKPVAPVPAEPDDPAKGRFSLAQATRGLRGTGSLFAALATEKGKLTCRLYEHRAPITVANFVGLARGLRPWKAPDGKWVRKPAYDGTVFHRISPGFMIQGGDANGNGTGTPGYEIPDEIWEDARHDRAGLLCMANHGPNTNGAQFFITDGPAPHLDGGYTIFGECEPHSVIHAIASGPRRVDRATSPVRIDKVTIFRKRG